MNSQCHDFPMQSSQSDVRHLILSSILAVSLMCLASHQGLSAEIVKENGTSRIDFNRDIRPILADSCFACHGPDENERKGGFRLDQRADILRSAESGALPVVAGNSEKSELFRRITSTDDSIRMPPPTGKHKPLTSAQTESIKHWIDEGAEYSSHWAFKAPQRPKMPQVEPTPHFRIANEIDAFVIEKLVERGMHQSQEADKTTLIRRLSLDLIGLPPSIAEVDAFLHDESLTAYQRQVERLLDSSHYGERWGRHWLDAARYADSDGFEKDKPRQIAFYRDWVIGAINRDLPYDQFVIEQLAGDLLPNATQDQIVATGFLRNSMLNEEGGVDPEQFRMDAMFDRMDAIGKTFLGLTIQCSQCHSHKYDPMTQEEYYRLFAFLNNDHESQRVVYSKAELHKIDELRQNISDIERRMQSDLPNWKEQMSQWEEGKKPTDDWRLLKLKNAGDNGQRYYDMSDGSILAQGYAPTKHSTNLRVDIDDQNLTAFRLELLNDPNLPCNGPGRSFMGTCALTDFLVEIEPIQEVEGQPKPGERSKLKFVSATADYSNPERDLESNFYDKTDKKRVTGSVEFAIDGKDETAWGIDQGPGRRNQPRQAVFVTEKPFGYVGGTRVHVSLRQMHGGWNSDDVMTNNLGRFRVSVTSRTNPFSDLIPIRVEEALQIPRSARTDADDRLIFSYWRTTVPQWKESNEKIESLWTQWPAGSTSLTLQLRESPRETRMLTRGDFLKPGKPVEPGVPAFLHPLSPHDQPLNRLALATWIVDRRSPTVARVLVNRIWQTYFGTGIVATSEDFGTKSDSPTHPELLDWLSVEFMERGWSLKNLHRLIVSSATYRQSSHMTPQQFEQDQYNRWMGRASRLRVEGEIVRDIALSASGLLNPKVGGPSLFSPAPAFLFVPPASYGPFSWNEVTGPDRYRRAIYTFRRRSTPYPMLTNFDVPNGDFSCVRRIRSNTPLQALTTLNETVFMECARNLALITLNEGGVDDASRLTWAFRRSVSRKPTDRERDVLLKLLRDQIERFSVPDSKPWELAANNPENPPQLPTGQSPAHAAAWTVVARVLLNLDETVTKE